MPRPEDEAVSSGPSSHRVASRLFKEAPGCASGYYLSLSLSLSLSIYIYIYLYIYIYTHIYT